MLIYSKLWMTVNYTFVGNTAVDNLLLCSG